MTITIRPEHEELIAQAIRTGAYQNPDDVIGRALEVSRSEDEWLAENRPAIGEHRRKKKEEKRWQNVRSDNWPERGEFFSPAESRADMEKRKAEWLHRQGG